LRERKPREACESRAKRGGTQKGGQRTMVSMSKKPKRFMVGEIP